MGDDLKVQPSQTLVRVQLMAVDETGTIVPVKVSGETGNQLGSGGGSSTSTSAVTSASNLTDNAIVRGDGGIKGVQTSGVLIDDSNNISGLLTIDVPNVGLKLRDADASNVMIVKPGSNLTADRTLTITTGDSDRTLTLAGNATESGTNTGDQTITLTSDVTGSGTGSFATTIAAGAVTLAKMSTAAKTSLQRKNLLINGEFAIAQRGTNFADVTSNAYTIDRWRALNEGATTQTLAQLFGSTNPRAKFYCSNLARTTNNKKFGIFQPIEGIDCYSARGQTVTLSAQLNATAGITDVRMAVVQWTSTEDAVSATPIATWGTTGNPTLTTWTYISESGTPTNKGVTTSWAQYSVTASVASTATNLGVLIWNNDQTTTANVDQLFIASVQLEIGDTVTDFDYRPIGQEKALCERFCWQLNSDVTNTQLIAFGLCTSGTNVNAGMFLPVDMRAVPSSVSISALADIIAFDGSVVPSSAGGTVTVNTASSAGRIVISATNTAGTLTTGRAGQLLLNNGASKFLRLDAEI